VEGNRAVVKIDYATYVVQFCAGIVEILVEASRPDET